MTTFSIILGLIAIAFAVASSYTKSNIHYILLGCAVLFAIGTVIVLRIDAGKKKKENTSEVTSEDKDSTSGEE